MTDQLHTNLSKSELLSMTAEIVAAYISMNAITGPQISEVISTVFSSLSRLDSALVNAPTELPKSAVPVRKSVTPDYIICLEDGKKLKMLKRYLRSAFGLTPDAYRARWGLPANYPMVAPNYSAKRSEFAKSIGLGRRSS
ncbi:MAG: MucR family transcriptional regulator [Rhodospirillaceae bacterium]